MCWKRRAMADGFMPDSRTLRVLALGVNWFDAGSGGLDRVFRDLALGLPDADVALRGLVLGPPEAGALTQGRVRAFGQGGRLPARLLAARQAVARAVREEAPDVVAAHFALFAAPALDLLGRRPFVMHFHGPWADEAAAEGAGAFGCALRRRLERSVYHRATRVITLSRAFAGLAHANYGIPESRIRVVPGSVDLARFAPSMSREAARAALGWPGGRPVILAVRRLVRRMGLDRLIAAMPRVRDAVPNAVLMIAGRGAEETALKTLAQTCGVADQMRFLGFLPEAGLPLAYRAADINVVPSRALEGFGLTAAEALAAGTPSLVAPTGGLPEVVAPLSQDLVFRSIMPADIAGGLIAALRGGAPGEDACLRYARERFSASRVIWETARIYREAAG
jgi:glycosyltransferase involved in cell wall biosynthesis